MEEKSFRASFQDLLRLFDRFWSAIFLHTPRPNLSKTPDERLLVGLVYLRWLRLEYVTKVLDRAFPGLSWAEAYKRGLAIIDTLETPLACSWLYSVDHNLDLLARYLRHQAIELFIFQEIEKRAKI